MGIQGPIEIKDFVDLPPEDIDYESYSRFCGDYCLWLVAFSDRKLKRQGIRTNYVIAGEICYKRAALVTTRQNHHDLFWDLSEGFEDFSHALQRGFRYMEQEPTKSDFELLAEEIRKRS